MRDYSGFEIGEIAKLKNVQTAQKVLEEIAQWVDDVSSVTEFAGNPTNRLYHFKTTNDLLQIAPDRRQACFQQLQQLAMYGIHIQDNYRKFVYRNKRSMGNNPALAYLKSWFIYLFKPDSLTFVVDGLSWRDTGSFTEQAQMRDNTVFKNKLLKDKEYKQFKANALEKQLEN